METVKDLDRLAQQSPSAFQTPSPMPNHVKPVGTTPIPAVISEIFSQRLNYATRGTCNHYTGKLPPGREEAK